MHLLDAWARLPDYPHTVASVWSLSIQQLSDRALALLGMHEPLIHKQMMCI
jgi:hypothetical protein